MIGKGRRVPKCDLRQQPRVEVSRSPSIPSRLSSGTWLQDAPIQQVQWLLPVPLVDLPLEGMYCLKEEIPVACRLVHFLSFWVEVIQADHWVLEIIRQGYSIELVRTHRFHRVQNTPVPRDGMELLSSEVEDLLRKGAIVQTPLVQGRSGYYSTYFLVPKKDGSLRPILNLKYFNLNVSNSSFKIETLRSIMVVMQLHQWMASMDLMDAYFHVPVMAVHHQFLRFSWLSTSYHFGILLFGLSSAPSLFTKTLAPLVVRLRLLGVQL